MICPNCGNETHKRKNCEICGRSTEFINRMNYLSVGSSRNPLQAASSHKDHPSVEIEKNSRFRWFTALVVLLAVLVAVESVCLIFLMCKDGSENYPETNSAIQQSTEYFESFDITETEEREFTTPITEGTAPSISTEEINQDVVQKEENPNIFGDQMQVSAELRFDLNLSENMQLISDSIEAPASVVIGEPLPEPFSADKDDYILTAGATSFRFVEWNTEKDGSGMSADIGDIVTLPLSESITLYAQWDVIADVDAAG